MRLLPLSLLALVVASSTLAAAEQSLLVDDGLDLLAADPFTPIAPVSSIQQPRWQDALRLTIEQQQAQSEQGTYLQRSSLRAEYEQGWGEGWYARVDGRLTHYWGQDAQARLRGESYSHSQLQQLWVQYSAGACAHKLGRQSLVWGEVDGAFVIDIITPLDYTEPLVTDFSNLRLGQEMLLSECYADGWQSQLFFLPDAQLDQLSHSGYGVSLDTGAEWGGRLKYSNRLGDFSLYAAHLYPNTPAPDQSLTPFNMLAFSTSLVRGSLLGKLDLAHKPHQPVAGSSGYSDLLELALGFEYLTRSNHNLNGGIIWSHQLDNVPGAPSASPLLTLGWSNSYLHDTLAMSLLAYASDKPRFSAINLLGEYKWDDHWTLAAALGLADYSEAAVSPFGSAERSLSVSVRGTF